jgi:CRP/FNR family transcriptional regulator
MQTSKAQVLRARFSDLTLIQHITREGYDATRTAGSSIIEQGQAVSHMPILINGLVRVMRYDSSGKEILLYHVKAGETCAFTALALHSHRKSSITAICEDDSTMILIPTHAHEYWFGKFDQWKGFILSSLEQRFSEMLHVVDNLAFHSVQDRLFDLLKEKQRLHESSSLHITHQELADALNTSREVVSRMLKQMEREGMLELHRNQIKMH